MLFPIQKEESLRELLFKNNFESIFLKESKEKNSIDILNLLLRSTRFNDISDILRVFCNKTSCLEILFKFFEISSYQGVYRFHFPIIKNFSYLIENFLHVFVFIEKFPIIQKILNSLFLSQRKLHLNDFLIKKLSANSSYIKSHEFFLTILNHESLISRKMYNIVQSHLNWFQTALEKNYTYNYYKNKLNFSVGKISLIENKHIKAFSLFIEIVEEIDENNFKNKLIAMHWLSFSSSLLKRNNLNGKIWSNFTPFKMKNLLEIKVLNSSIEKNNIILWEYIVFKTGKQPFFLDSLFLHIKKIFKTVSQLIKQILSIFSRLSIQNLTKKIGISRKRMEIILSYCVLKGRIRGYLDCTNDTFVTFLKKKPQIKIKSFTEASIKLAVLMNLSLERKILDTSFFKK